MKRLEEQVTTFFCPETARLSCDSYFSLSLQDTEEADDVSEAEEAGGDAASEEEVEDASKVIPNETDYRKGR